MIIYPWRNRMRVPDQFCLFLKNYYPTEKKEILDFFFRHFVPEIINIGPSDRYVLSTETTLELLYCIYSSNTYHLSEMGLSNPLRHFVFEFQMYRRIKSLMTTIFNNLNLARNEFISESRFISYDTIEYEIEERVYSY